MSSSLLRSEITSLIKEAVSLSSSDPQAALQIVDKVLIFAKNDINIHFDLIKILISMVFSLGCGQPLTQTSVFVSRDLGLASPPCHVPSSIRVSRLGTVPLPKVRITLTHAFSIYPPH